MKMKMNKPLKNILNTFSSICYRIISNISEDPDPVVRFFRRRQAATFKFSAMARKRSKRTTTTFFFCALLSIIAFCAFVPVFAPLPSLSSHANHHSQHKKVKSLSILLFRLGIVFANGILLRYRVFFFFCSIQRKCLSLKVNKCA
jgi:hypothetical protein